MIPFKAFLVHKDPHQFRYHKGGMRLVEMDEHLLRQHIPAVVVQTETTEDVAHRTGHKEVLLLETQLLAGHRVVVRIENLCEILRENLVLHRCDVRTLVEVRKIEFVKCARTPQTKRVDGMLVSDNRQIVRNTLHGDSRMPGPLQFPVGSAFALNMSSKGHRLRIFRPFDFPRISILEPVVGLLHLLAVDDLLAEDAVVVANAVAHGSEVERGHRIEIACCETSQTSIAKACIHLKIAQGVPVDAVGAQSVAAKLISFEVYDVVAEQTTDEEFKRKVIYVLGILLAVLGLGVHPPFRDAIPNRMSKSEVSVTGRCRHLVLRERVPEMVRIIALKPCNAHLDASRTHFAVIHSSLSLVWFKIGT